LNGINIEINTLRGIKLLKLFFDQDHKNNPKKSFLVDCPSNTYYYLDSSNFNYLFYSLIDLLSLKMMVQI